MTVWALMYIADGVPYVESLWTTERDARREAEMREREFPQAVVRFVEQVPVQTSPHVPFRSRP